MYIVEDKDEEFVIYYFNILSPKESKIQILKKVNEIGNYPKYDLDRPVTRPEFETLLKKVEETGCVYHSLLSGAEKRFMAEVIKP
jgi:hypothetical protein